MSVTPGQWENVSRVQLSDPQWLERLQDFRLADLTLPKQWPRSTLVYAGARLTPATAWQTLRELGLLNGGMDDDSFGKLLMVEVVAPLLQT